jgi:hypothetical protein
MCHLVMSMDYLEHEHVSRGLVASLLKTMNNQNRQVSSSLLFEYFRFCSCDMSKVTFMDGMFLVF